jgi:hypothetical protein
MDIWAIAISVTPVVSRPAEASYDGRGIWTQKPVLVDTGTGQLLTKDLTLGIDLAEWLPPYPTRDDQVTIPDGPGGSPDIIGTWTISEFRPDGQGGAELVLKNRSRFTG